MSKKSRKSKSPPFSEKELRRFRLVEDFQERLEAARGEDSSKGTHADSRRELTQKHYLSLLLFGLFNPVVHSMRGVIKATGLRRVQDEICSRPVSLGSFSEMQSVVDPDLLKRVFDELAAEHQPERWGDARLSSYSSQLMAVDGTLWPALPRMGWALWRVQNGSQSAIKLHLKFNILEQKPAGAVIAAGRRCERAVLRENLKKGEFYVADRYYGEDYRFLDQMKKSGCSYVVRLREEAVYEVVQEYPLKEVDRTAGVLSDCLVKLGSRAKVCVRLVRVQIGGTQLLLASDKSRDELGAELIALIYRYRWQVELFFKWIKCIMGCRHWLAESERGVALQVYCALIAALILMRFSGQRPGKRAMEMIRFYLMGYASPDELCEQLGVEKRVA